MSRRRPALQRFNHALGGMSTRNLDDLVDREALAAETQAGIDRARAQFEESSRRIHHPAIKAPEFKCYRVIRRWKGEEYCEDIGFFRSQGDALILLRREQGWAQVLDPNGKPIAHNWQWMETR